MTIQKYVGKELELFGKDTNWKRYLRGFISPYLKGKVLEVGAGMGNATCVLCDGTQESWLCLEPDPAHSKHIEEDIQRGKIPGICRIRTGMMEDLEPALRFKAIVYIDVIEHIENDRQEIESAVSHLEEGGYLIIVAPALQWLFSPFDEEIGHYRRYDRENLRGLMPGTLRCLMIKYLDCLGILLLLGNRLMLRQKMPRAYQVRAWDSLIVPLSRIADHLIGYRFGRSLLGIWQYGNEETRTA
jgi:hypothetical protein